MVDGTTILIDSPRRAPRTYIRGRVTSLNRLRERSAAPRARMLPVRSGHNGMFRVVLGPGSRHQEALLSVVHEAYLEGVSTRSAHSLAEALGITEISPDRAGRVGQELDGLVDSLRSHRLGAYPYLMLATSLQNVRESGRIEAMLMVVALGVRTAGEREVIGAEVGPAGDEMLWREFVRSLVRRGLRGVRLVTAHSHPALKRAVTQVLPTAAWQACRIDLMNRAAEMVPRSDRKLVRTTLRAIFDQPDWAASRAAIERACLLFQARFPELAGLVERDAEDLLTYHDFPREHRQRIWSTNAERLTHEVNRRCRIVGVFPSRAILLRLVSVVLGEQNTSWTIGQRYVSKESMRRLSAE